MAHEGAEAHSSVPGEAAESAVSFIRSFDGMCEDLTAPG